MQISSDDDIDADRPHRHREPRSCRRRRRAPSPTTRLRGCRCPHDVDDLPLGPRAARPPPRALGRDRRRGRGGGGRRPGRGRGQLRAVAGPGRAPRRRHLAARCPPWRSSRRSPTSSRRARRPAPCPAAAGATASSAPRVLGVGRAWWCSPPWAAPGSSSRPPPRRAPRSPSWSTAPGSRSTPTPTRSARCSPPRGVRLGPRRRRRPVGEEPRCTTASTSTCSRAFPVTVDVDGNVRTVRTVETSADKLRRAPEAEQAHRGAQQPRSSRRRCDASCTAPRVAGSLTIDNQKVTFDSPSRDGRRAAAGVQREAGRRRLRRRRRPTPCCTTATQRRRGARRRPRPRRPRGRSTFDTVEQEDPTLPIGQTRDPPGRQRRHHDRHVPPARRERSEGRASRWCRRCRRSSRRRRSRHTAATPTRSGTSSRECESGGRWDTVDSGPDGYDGGLGIYRGTWRAFGGADFAPNAGPRHARAADHRRHADLREARLGPVGLREQRPALAAMEHVTGSIRADADLVVSFHGDAAEAWPDGRDAGAESTVIVALLTPATVHALLDAHGLHPKRSLGQNFLADPNTARRVVALADVAPGDPVLEIGPGLGSLTLALLDAGHDVVALELDHRLADVLRRVLADDGRLRRAERRRSATPRPSTSPPCSPSRRPVGVRVEPAVQRRGAGGGAPARGGRGGRAHPRDGAARGGGAPRRRARRRAVRRGVGEGRLLRRGRRWWARCRRRCSCPAQGRLRAGAAAPPRGAAGDGAVGRRTVHAGAGRVRAAAQDAAAFAAPVLGDATPTTCSTAAGVAPTARAEALGLDDWAAVARSAAAAA